MRAKAIIVISLITVVMVTGCLGGGSNSDSGSEVISMDEYQEVRETVSPNSGSEDASIERVNMRDITLEMTLLGVAPASNYGMTINEVTIDGNTLIVDATLEETSDVGNTVVSQVSNRIVVLGENLDNIEEIQYNVEGNVGSGSYTYTPEE